MKKKRRALINFVGTILFTLPVTALLWISSVPYVSESWRTMEGSIETTGLQLVYLLKSCLILFTLSLTLFALTNLVRTGKILFGKDET